eukprot:TRINITY_DN17922_c0_g1_i1.p1 TRINITY_DN17922_c0_g1~~TRINITY_DN17922_c0_g1_i1.p1  ORF type:complete len:1327 (-),score=191.01 TRINITY_DN17922_c0_g1_i1:399-4379(-)
MDDENLARLLSLLEGSAISVIQARSALQRVRGDVVKAVALLFGDERPAAAAAFPAPLPAGPLSIDDDDEGEAPEAGSGSSRGSSPQRLAFRARRAVYRPREKPKRDQLLVESVQARDALLSEPSRKRARMSSASSQSNLRCPSATPLPRCSEALQVAPWKDPDARQDGFVRLAQNDGWTLFDSAPSNVAGSEWAARQLEQDPPCLSLRGSQADTLMKMSTGEMHEGWDESRPCGSDFRIENDEVLLRELRLIGLFRELLERVRYPPVALECSWRACRVSGSSEDIDMPAGPVDLQGRIADKPFGLLDNAGDAPAPQPPRFSVHPLRPEQLRSLSWMLMREGNLPSQAGTSGQHESFVTEWRRYWMPLDSGPVSSQIIEGAPVRMKRMPGMPGHLAVQEGMVVGRRQSRVAVRWNSNAVSEVLIQDLEFRDTGRVTVGSRVKIRPGLKTPAYGWGGVTAESVGIVLKLDGQVMTVRFPQHNTWKGLASELTSAGIVGDTERMVEVRARAKYTTRGGILADKIGYGKTATTIGLIDSTAHLPLPEIPALDSGGFIPAKGTLIIVPSNLLDQWLSEFAKFVWDGHKLRGNLKSGWSPSGCPLKIFAMTNVTALTKVKASELAEADVVLCSYRLLFSQVYVQRRNQLGGTSLADLVSRTRTWLCGRGSIPSGRKGDHFVSDWRELTFPVLELFYWRRVVFDEFHELESFENLQQNSLQHFRAHYRWGLTGTPPVERSAGVIFMSSLFRIDLPSFLGENIRSRSGHGNDTDLSPWEGDRLLAEQSANFLETFVRQNTAELPHIGLQEHVVLVRHTPEERALYLGQAHDAPDLDDVNAFKTPDNVGALERLLRLCSHFQAGGGSEHGSSARAECSRIGDQKERKLVRATNQVQRCCRVIVLLRRVFESLPGAGELPAGWNNVLLDMKKKLSSEGDNSCKAVADAESAEKHAEAESAEARMIVLSEHYPRDSELASVLGAGDSKRGYADQWSQLVFHLVRSQKTRSADASKIIDLLQRQAEEQAQNLKEFVEASASLAFFKRAVTTMAADDSPATRSCTVCLEEGLQLTRLAITPCAHTFCIDCLKMTIAKFKSCSICRQPLSQKDMRPIAAEVVQEKPAASSSSASSSTAEPTKTTEETVNGTPLDKYGTKLAAVVRKLQELRREDRTAKVILFVQFDDLKRKVAAALSEFGVPTVQLHGNVSQRANVIHDWQYNPNSASFVLLLSLAQSASGTNLTSASHVVFLHPMLASTPEVAVGHEMQAIGRARRHGQLRDTVHVWRFVTAETIEQAITERHQSSLWQREQRASGAPAASAHSGAGAGAASASGGVSS